jgi:hypothetical protein
MNNTDMETHRELLDRIARQVVARRLTAPVILFLESMKPLSFLGGQTLLFFSPFVRVVVNTSSYDAFAEAMESRENVEYLIGLIERYSDEENRSSQPADPDKT